MGGKERRSERERHVHVLCIAPHMTKTCISE